jgi:hypothetical protein
MVAELSRQKEKYYVVHNIDGLQEGYLGDYGINFLKYCDDQKIDIVEFFSKDYQIEFTKAVLEKYNRPVLAIIDEAHEWFSVNSKNLKMWLSYHRHLNQDIWLVAHRSTNIPAMYRSFIEVEYRAKSGSFLNVPYYFFYNRILGGQQSGYVKERKSKKIFEIYKSQLIGKVEKKKTPKVMVVLVAGVVFGVALFFFIPQFILADDPMDLKKLKKGGAAADPSVVMVENQITGQLANKNLDSAKIKIMEKTFEEKWAFVGAFAGYVVLEDRESGVQYPIEKIDSDLRLVEVQRDTFVILSKKGQFITCYNNKRHQAPVKKDGFGVGQQTTPKASDVSDVSESKNINILKS